AKQRDIIAGNRPGSALPPAFLAHPVWKRLYDFCVLWADEDSTLHTNIHNIWLEFDIDGAPQDIPVPGIFFGSETIQRVDNPDDLAWVSEQAVPMLTGKHLSDTVTATMIDAIQALPDDARVFQVGAMVNRDPAFVRLCIKDIAPDAILPYLARIGWRGNPDELQTLIRTLAGIVDHVDLDIDVSDTISAKIGLEAYFMPRANPGHHDKWDDFFTYLMDNGMCLPEKRTALHQFPGILNEQDNRADYPKSLLAASGVMGRRYHSFIAHGIYHIKIVYQPGRALEAKAYLWVEHTWLSREQLRVMREENTPAEYSD
ncbi:MAG: hypothetical protein ACPG7F_22650, partial [Aggregatilineales bacterium]